MQRATARGARPTGPGNKRYPMPRLPPVTIARRSPRPERGLDAAGIVIEVPGLLGVMPDFAARPPRGAFPLSTCASREFDRKTRMRAKRGLGCTGGGGGGERLITDLKRKANSLYNLMVGFASLLREPAAPRLTYPPPKREQGIYIQSCIRPRCYIELSTLPCWVGDLRDRPTHVTIFACNHPAHNLFSSKRSNALV